MDTPGCCPVRGSGRRRSRLAFVFVLSAILFLPSSIWSQSRITGSIDDTRLVTLHGNTHPLAQASFDRGAVPGSFPAERMILSLKRSVAQENSLQEFLGQVQNPASPAYHQYLTPAQFGQQYGVSESDLEVVTAWLRSAGFAVNRIHSGRIAIEFSGTAGQVQSAFHTSIHSYVVNGEQHFANASDPMIPAALAPVVGGVALAGGSGTMLQAFYGVLVLGLLSNALNMAGVSSFLQVLVVGVVILLAVIVDRLRTRTAV